MNHHVKSSSNVGSRSKRRVALATLMLLATSSCSEEASQTAQATDQKWRSSAAHGISAGELVLHTWCDDGATLSAVESSSDAGVASVREAALSVRSLTIDSSDPSSEAAYKDLLGLSDVLQTAGSMAKYTREVPDASSAGGPLSRTLIYQELTPREKEMPPNSNERLQAEDRAVDELRARRIEAIEQAMTTLRSKSSALSRTGSFAVSEGVVDRAVACVESLADAEIDRTRSLE